MSYSTLLVHLDARGPNTHVLTVAAHVAQQHHAKIIGMAACQPKRTGTLDGDFIGQFMGLEHEIAEEELKVAEAEFRDFGPIQAFVLDWRAAASMEPIAQAVADEARSADLVIASVRSGPESNASRHADVGELILRAGRPVLVVPESSVTSRFATVMVAWAETRECRRAISDAIPLLKSAERVVLVQIASVPGDARGRSQDVLAWLARHGVNADQVIRQSTGDDAEGVAAVAVELGADLIVAGAYGHNRLREWMFGGVTRDLLLRDDRCALLSH